jgi:hypothetical protein
MSFPLAALAISDEQMNSISDICAAMLQSGRTNAIIRTRLDNHDYLLVLSDKGVKGFVQKGKAIYPLHTVFERRELANAELS